MDERNVSTCADFYGDRRETDCSPCERALGNLKSNQVNMIIWRERNNNFRVNKESKEAEKQTQFKFQECKDGIPSEEELTEPRGQSDAKAVYEEPRRFSRTLSETDVGQHTVANTAKLRRASSVSEIRSRLAGCPKGLLISTEPPRSGESYRRRSNSTLPRRLTRNVVLRTQERSETENEDRKTWQEEKHIVLLELESMKRQRLQLQRENERLKEELENRNKVIDHLIDFMKSSFPGDIQQNPPTYEIFGGPNNPKKTQSLENV